MNKIQLNLSVIFLVMLKQLNLLSHNFFEIQKIETEFFIANKL